MPDKPALQFYEKSHRYKLDGQWIPGVTTLIGDGLPKKALMYWSARTVAEYVADNPDAVDHLRTMGRGPMVAALKETPWQKRDDAAARGTEVHALAERLVHGEPVDVPEHIDGHVEGYARWLDAEQPEPIWTERPVASRKWWYAGTFDLIANLRGETWLLDVKTSSSVYGDTALQLAAYANADFLLTPDGVEEPLPPITRLGILHVRWDGTDLYPIKGDIETPFKDFLHAAWTAKGKDRIKGYLAEPLTAPEPQDAA